MCLGSSLGFPVHRVEYCLVFLDFVGVGVMNELMAFEKGGEELHL